MTGSVRVGPWSADTGHPLTQVAPERTREVMKAEFERFHRSEYPRLIATLHALSGDRARARTTVDKAFVSAWSHWSTVRGLPSPGAWTRREAMASRAGMWFRARAGARERDGANPVSVVALRRVPDVQRRALVLRHVVGLAPEQVAAEEAASLDTVHTRLAHGAVALLHHLDDRRHDAALTAPIAAPTDDGAALVLGRLAHQLAATDVPPVTSVFRRVDGGRHSVLASVAVISVGALGATAAVVGSGLATNIPAGLPGSLTTSGPGLAPPSRPGPVGPMPGAGVEREVPSGTGPTGPTGPADPTAGIFEPFIPVGHPAPAPAAGAVSPPPLATASGGVGSPSATNPTPGHGRGGEGASATPGPPPSGGGPSSSPGAQRGAPDRGGQNGGGHGGNGQGGREDAGSGGPGRGDTPRGGGSPDGGGQDGGHGGGGRHGGGGTGQAGGGGHGEGGGSGQGHRGQGGGRGGGGGPGGR